MAEGSVDEQIKCNAVLPNGSLAFTSDGGHGPGKE